MKKTPINVKCNRVKRLKTLFLTNPNLSSIVLYRLIQGMLRRPTYYSLIRVSLIMRNYIEFLN